MVKVGKWNVGMRRKMNFGWIIGSLIELFVTAYMGDKIIAALKTSLFGACTKTGASACMFYDLYDLAGVLNGSSGSPLIGIFGIIGFAALLMGFVRISKM